MEGEKQRSAIFKFFYVLLSIVTFPIFALLFILRHPLWLLFVLLVLTAGVVYYPMKQGVALNDVLSWYQNMYNQVKFDVVSKAVEKGEADFIPDSIKKEVAEVKKKLEEEKFEAELPKSENYNEKLDRNFEMEKAKENLKKRKSGFKKQSEDQENAEPLKDEQNLDVLLPAMDENNAVSGGLENIISVQSQEQKDEGMVNVDNPLPQLQPAPQLDGSFLGKNTDGVDLNVEQTKSQQNENAAETKEGDDLNLF